MSAQINTSPIHKGFSMPRLLLHLEGLMILVSAVILYANLGFRWSIFALLLFAPDLPMLLYFIDQRLASIAYNMVHSIILPLVLLFISFFNNYQFGVQIAIIWLAHIGMDHLFGYGFKYLGDFKETHFSRI